MSVPLNIIEFAIDLWENYLIYNLDELWNRCQNLILKPHPSIKEAYLKILELLSKRISIIYSPENAKDTLLKEGNTTILVFPKRITEGEFYYDKGVELERYTDDSKSLGPTLEVINLDREIWRELHSLDSELDSSIDNLVSQMRKDEIIDYMEAMSILPKITDDLNDQENPFFNVRDLIKEYIEIQTRLGRENLDNEKEQNDLSNKLESMKKKFKEFNIIAEFSTFKLKRGDPKIREIIFNRLEELMKNAAWFEINSKNFIDHLANKHNCVDFVNKYKESILSHYELMEHYDLDLSIWNYRTIMYDVILSLYGISEKDLCERIRSLDNIESDFGFKTPFFILFTCPDEKYHEKTHFLYQKETIDKVSHILKEAIKKDI